MSEKTIKNLENEIMALQLLSDSNSEFVVKLHDKIKTQSKFYLILDYCNGGDLDSILATVK